MRLSAPWPSWFVEECSEPPTSPAALESGGRSAIEGTIVTGVRLADHEPPPGEPEGVAEVMVRGPMAWTPRRTPVTR